MQIFKYTPAAIILAGSLVAYSAANRSLLVVKASNSVGLRLMQEVTKEDAKKPAGSNLMISPLSAQEALSMALNGTAGKTRSEFMEFFGYAPDADLSEINGANLEALSALIKKPMTAEEKKKLKSWEKPSVGFTVANSAWRTNGQTDGRKYDFKKEFVAVLEQSYGVSEPQGLDFKSPVAVVKINSWVTEKTNGMIKEIVDQNTLSPLLWVLLNATYMEGSWANQFRVIKSDVPDVPNFTLASNKTIVAPMMSQTAVMGYYEDGHVQSVELSLAKSDVAVYVIAPKSIGDYLELQKEGGVWSKEYLTKVISETKAERGSLTMPKFTFDYGVELKKDDAITRELGLNFLFQNTANFTNMDMPESVPSKVGIIKQNTRIEWDEYGIKAAAATMVGGIERTSVRPAPQFNVVVDKPFFFAIYDGKTQSYLFLGQVADPTKTK